MRWFLLLFACVALLSLGASEPAPDMDAAKIEEDEQAIIDTDELDRQLEEARRALSSAAKELAQLHKHRVQLDHQELASRGALGVVLGPAGEVGVPLVGVTPGGGADQAGLEAGDVLVAIEGTDLRGGGGGRKLMRLMQSVAPGDVVTLEYMRDGVAATADVTTQALPTIAFEPFEFELATPAPMMGIIEGAPFAARAFALHGGLHLFDLSPELGRYFGVSEGVLVLNAPDAEEGLEPGDVLKSVQGEAVASVAEAHRALREAEGEVALEVLRDGATLSIRQSDLGASGLPVPGKMIRGKRVIRLPDGGAAPDGEVIQHDVLLHTQ